MSSYGGALADALVAALLANGPVAALVGVQVFDETPSDGTIQPPFIFIGPIGSQRQPDVAFHVWSARVRIYCVSAEFGRDQVWSMADAVSLALDEQKLTLASGFVMNWNLQEDASGDVVEPQKPKMTFVDFTCGVSRTSPV